MRSPALHLGALGHFTTADRMMLANQLAGFSDSGFEWQFSDSTDVDAVLLNGAQCHLEHAENPEQTVLSVGVGEGRELKVKLSDWHTPTILNPPAEAGLQAFTQFLWIEPLRGGAKGLHKALHVVTAAMRYERTLYALGEGIVRHPNMVFPDLGKAHARVVHITDEAHHLVAIVVPQERALYFNPHAEPCRSHAWEWGLRPAAAAASHPEHFVQTSIEEALWEYAMRCPEIDWPIECPMSGLHLLRRPNVRPSMLKQRHAQLLQQFQAHDATAHARDYAMAEEGSDHTRDLYALHLCGCLYAERPAGTALHRKTDARSGWIERLARSLRQMNVQPPPAHDSAHDGQDAGPMSTLEQSSFFQADSRFSGSAF